MRNPIVWLTALLILGSAVAHPVSAAEAALVEEVSNPHPGLEAMDRLSSGQRIVLGAGDRLVVTYLASCTRETIIGGTVAVGTEASTVEGGKVSRETIECHGGKLQLSSEQASKSAVVEFRRAPRPRIASTAAPN